MAATVVPYAMDFVATQPSTLPQHNGAYSAEEYDDVLCILQPASQPAMVVCQNIWKETPTFILQHSNAGLRADGTIQDEIDLEMIGAEDTQGPRDTVDNEVAQRQDPVRTTNQDAALVLPANGQVEDLSNTEVVEETQPLQPTNLDIALRTSANVKDFALGFVFGRDLHKSDIKLATNCPGDARISSMHFRIHLNQYGILVLEDTSTNGTTVDDEWLGKNYKNRTKILSHGSTIEFITNSNRDIKAVGKAVFVVKLPKRNDAAYKENLKQYVMKVARFKQEREQTVDGIMFPKPANPHKLRHKSDVSNMDLLIAGTERNTLANGWTANGRYRVDSELGKGAFAIVYKVTTTTGDEVQAAKRIDRAAFMKNGVVDVKFLHELEIMQKVDHPHIVHFHDHDVTSKYLFIIMEYVPCGDLAPNALQKGFLGIPILKSITRQLLHALAYIHRNGIVHRDIKPENILVHTRDPFYVKLSDFGLSKMIEKEEKAALLTFCGTLLYCAPEIYPDYEQVRAGLPRVKRKSSAPKPYSSAVDIWSLGTVMYHLIASKPPFKGSGEDQGYKMLRAVIFDDIDYEPLSTRGVDPNGVAFVNSMIDIDGESRPSAVELLSHPWMQDVSDIVPIPNLEESQIIMNINDEGLETLDEEDEWDKIQSESFLRAAGALIKTPTPDVPSLSNGDISADDKIPITENDFSDDSFQAHIDSVAMKNVNTDTTTQANGARQVGPRIGSAQPNQPWFKNPAWPEHYTNGNHVEDSPSGSEEDTPQQARPEKLFGEISQDLSLESGIFGADSQPTIRPIEGSRRSPPYNSPSLFGTESKMNGLNMRASRANQSMIRSAVANSVIHGKRYRSTATSGSDESNTSSIEEPAAKRSMIRLGEPLQANGNSAAAQKSPSPDVSRSLSQKVDELQLSGTRLATLTPIPGCMSSEEIYITTRLSNFGRSTNNTNVYEDMTDSRVPRCAFDMYFYAPNTGRIRDKAWYKDPALVAVIMAGSNAGIKVNGVHIPFFRTGGVFKIATVKTGDLIEVYESARKKLVYRCVFHVGESQFTRAADEEVVVEDSAELFEAANNGMTRNPDEKTLA